MSCLLRVSSAYTVHAYIVFTLLIPSFPHAKDLVVVFVSAIYSLEVNLIAMYVLIMYILKRYTVHMGATCMFKW